MDAKLRASRERPHSSAGGEGIRRHRMRFSVRVRTQNASFRRVRFSSPAQTWRRLTEKRILCRRPHGKAHSPTGASRKSAFCTLGLTEKRILHVGPHGKAHSPTGASRKSAVCARRLTKSTLCDPQTAKLHLSVRQPSQSAPLTPRDTQCRRIRRDHLCSL